LEGYDFTVLEDKVDGRAVKSKWWGDPRVDRMIATWRPKAVLLHQINSKFNMAVYLGAMRQRIPLWFRMETQDYAFERSRMKDFVRSIVYHLLYPKVNLAFIVGEANREHLLKHGIPARKLRTARYGTSDPLAGLAIAQKSTRRAAKRRELGFEDQDIVIAFFGKLIPKKDPSLLQQAYSLLPAPLRARTRILYVGSGELGAELLLRDDDLKKSAVREVSHFAGFVNQKAIPDYYLAADILVLPSRRMGETWGLVVNEALQAGCAAVVSEAAGCSREFGAWERVRVIPVGDAPALAASIEALSGYPRDFNWAAELMKDYTIEAAATAIAAEIKMLA
jgi:glycosyltransferase involved in cell wall biosynthesis